MADKRQRIFNTRQRKETRDKPQKQPPQIIAFNGHTQTPDENGFVWRHLVPATYYCKQLQIFIDNTSGARIRMGVDDSEYVERDIKSGLNIFQVERIIPAGSRIKLQIIDGTAAGVWIAWTGVLNA